MGAIAPGVRDEARYDYAAMSPATVTDATDAALAEAERLIEAVVGAPDPRTFDSTIRPLAAAAAVVSAADGVGSRPATSTLTRRSGTRRMPPRSAPRSGGRAWPGATTWRPRSSPTPTPTRPHRSTGRAVNRSTCGSATSGAPGTAYRPSSARSSPPSTTGSPTSASRSAGTSATGTTTWSWARPTWWACRRHSSTDCLPARSPGAASRRGLRDDVRVHRAVPAARPREIAFAKYYSRAAALNARSSPSSSPRAGAPLRPSAPTHGASSRTRPGCPAAGPRSWPSSRA